MVEYTGLFVVLEGIDGSGKTSQLHNIKSTLEAKGKKVHITGEPSKGRLGPILREYLSDPTSHFAADALIFAADRVEHYFNEIKPKVDDGYIVVCDRYKASSVVYQGSTHLSDDWIEAINSQVPEPDLTVYLKLDADSAIERLTDSERTHLEKFETVEKLKHLLSRYEGVKMNNLQIVHADQSPDAVTDKIVGHIMASLS
ncbi:MAG: dTMP kinase [Candidatus Kariarchaeaceae archaeon]